MSEETVHSHLLWDRWDEVDRLLSAVLDLDPSERAAYVDGQTAGDEPLRRLLLRLVDRLEASDPRVTSPSGRVVAAAFGVQASSGPADLEPGTELGSHVIVQRRARGGMATVYEADRSDGAYRQRVAVKVLRRGIDTDDVVRRFFTERQILSSLAHPNIARLLDGGSTPDGRPYLVMELVEGRPITAHADARRLNVRARLELFLEVADAVHAAHRQLVVHRDIKPSNILVDDDGAVKLLDFGIAKLIEGDPEHTSIGRLLTPDYASPEQLVGGRITTATDVYQLGLLLRELLTGVKRVAGAGEAPDTRPRPSRLAARPVERAPDPDTRAARRATTPQRLARRLRGDLDLVVGKALRPAPEDRYPSAAELAADVRRHLAGLPVVAHHESAAYRTRKFVGRHAWGVGVACGAAVLLLGYAATVTMQNRRIAGARDGAVREARKAEQVTGFLVDLFRAADPNRAAGEEVTARDLLDDGARRLDQDPVGDGAVRAALLGAIGTSYHQLGLYAEAERRLEQAVAILRETGPADELVRALNSLARAVAARDRPGALIIAEEALHFAEAALGPDHPLAGVVLTDISVLLSYVHPGDPRIEPMQARAVDILRRAPAEWRGELAGALTVWSYGRPTDVAVRRAMEAFEIRRALHPGPHTAVAASLSDLALILEPVDPLAADSLMQEALDMLTAIHGRRHGTVLAIMGNLAALRRDRGAYDLAEPLYREALALRRELYPEQRFQQAYSLYGLGLTLAETGRAEEGEARLREALEILGQEAPGSPLLPVTRIGIGHAVARQRRFAEAEAILLEAWNEVLPGPLGAPEKARALGRIVSLYEAWDRDEPARRFRMQLDSLVAAHGLSGSRHPP